MLAILKTTLHRACCIVRHEAGGFRVAVDMRPVVQQRFASEIRARRPAGEDANAARPSD